jgi:hypothetical protein
MTYPATLAACRLNPVRSMTGSLHRIARTAIPAALALVSAAALNRVGNDAVARAHLENVHARITAALEG